MILHPVIIRIPREPQASACAVPSCTAALEQYKKVSLSSLSQHVRMQRASARAALRESAHLSGAPLEGWRQDVDGAPEPNNGFCWSVSHKRQYAAAVVALFPVGIDIEQITPRCNKLWDEVANTKEWRLVGPKNWRNFFYLWSAKESVLKAACVGLKGLSLCRVMNRREDDRIDVRYLDKLFTVQWFEHDSHVVAITDQSATIQWTLHGHASCGPCPPNGVITKC